MKYIFLILTYLFYVKSHDPPEAYGNQQETPHNQRETDEDHLERNDDLDDAVEDGFEEVIVFTIIPAHAHWTICVCAQYNG